MNWFYINVLFNRVIITDICIIAIQYYSTNVTKIERFVVGPSNQTPRRNNISHKSHIYNWITHVIPRERCELRTIPIQFICNCSTLRHCSPESFFLLEPSRWRLIWRKRKHRWWCLKCERVFHKNDKSHTIFSRSRFESPYLMLFLRAYILCAAKLVVTQRGRRPCGRRYNVNRIMNRRYQAARYNLEKNKARVIWQPEERSV